MRQERTHGKKQCCSMKRGIALLLACILLLSLLPMGVVADDNTAPTLVQGVSAQTSEKLSLGDFYTLDLTTIFTDAQRDPLTYMVQVNDAQAVEAKAAYCYAPTQTGNVKLVFTANDGKLDSASYTVVLTVEQPSQDEITVYVSVSEDGNYVSGNDDAGTLMCKVPVKISYFDLQQYNLQKYNRYTANSFADGGKYNSTVVVQRPTLLHLYIKVLEQYYLNGATVANNTDVLSCNGNATSLYLTKFWGHNANLMYFVNHEYPLMAKNWGATADYTLLHDGDEIDIGMFSGYSFYTNGYFSNLTADKNQINVGESVNFSLTGTSTDSSGTVKALGERMTVYCSTVLKGEKADYTDAEKVTTIASDGSFSKAFATAGTYYMVAFDNNAADTSKAAIVPSVQTIRVGNHAPTLQDDITAQVSANVETGKPYQLDLTRIFKDPDGDALTYQVQVDDAAAVAASAAYTFMPQSDGTYTLHFTATDGLLPCAQDYTVTLTAAAAKGHKVKLRFWAADTVGNPKLDPSYTYTITDKDNTPILLNTYTAESNNMWGFYEPNLENGMYTMTVKNGTNNLGTCTFLIQDSTTQLNFTKITLKSNDGFVAATDYTAAAVCEENGVTTATITPAVQADGSYSAVGVLTIHTWTVTPSAAQQALGYGPASVSKSLYSAITLNCTYTAPTPVGGTDTITVPEGASVWVGVAPEKCYQDYTTVAPAGAKETVAGKDVYAYNLSAGEVYCYRVYAAGKLTVTDKFTRGQSGESLIVTDAQMSESATQINRNDGYYEGNLLTNAGKSGQISLSVNQHFSLLALRQWQIIDGETTNYTMSPDFHYEIISGENVATVSDTGVITAKAAGTAIITVTYDAIRAMNHSYSAIYPENTGVIVVNVDAKEVDTGLDLDSEFDVLYYLAGQDGYDLSFTPEQGSTVSVLRPTISETAATYDAFTTQGVSTKDGKVHVLLGQGRNVIRVEKDGAVSYQVLSVKKLQASLYNDTKKEIVTPQTPADPGDSIRVTFQGLTAALGKLACIYNYQNGLKYLGEDKAHVGSGWTEVTWGGASYDFITQRNSISFTIPEAWDKDTYRLTGVVNSSGYGSIPGDHRSIDPAVGASQNTSAVTRAFDFGVLPELVIPVTKTNTAPALAQGVPSQDATSVITGYACQVDLSAIFTDADGDPLTYTVQVDQLTAQTVDAQYEFTAQSSGTYTLRFVANDGTDNSPAYTLTVSAANIEDLYGDVTPDDWFYEEIGFVSHMDLMNGVGEGVFAPKGTMNRAMLVTVLYRMAGMPEVTGTMTFSDVESGRWYTKAVLWASQNNITNGAGGGRFKPFDAVTREQIALFFMRYADAVGLNTTARADLSRYTDAGKISAWAQTAMQWAGAHGFITGRSATTLVPDGTATRAEVATILMRFYNADLH